MHSKWFIEGQRKFAERTAYQAVLAARCAVLCFQYYLTQNFRMPVRIDY